MTIATRIRQARERLGLTQTEAAEKARMRQGTWSAYETGAKKDPRASTIRHMCGVLGISADDLIGKRA
jgi:transcriptional regulator with XRE-family HTH domain